ncbi:MAG: HlyD family efflux transporter periplasmic adaptor subunit [Lacisediminimonas sp.]|nr:HlyD family efflux transporter periplasmic adaptor subunit [Lacisediminimonas sp.]MDO8299238.1 HlyD family efflux transporter periplasmic adaptor subunit [Lacisediminimonas sp.]
MAAPGAHGPNGEHLAGVGTGNATGLVRLPDGSVNVPKQAQRRMALRTTMARQVQHPVTVELNGKVGIDPNAGGRIQAPFAARVEPGPRGLPVAGQRVQKGQVLLHLKPVSSAIERGNQQAQLADIRANHKLAEQRVKRLESLEGAVPQKEIDAARAELASLSGRQRAVSDSIGGTEVVSAPASGVIASAHVMTGQIVEARELLLEIVDPNRLVVEATTTDVALAGRIGGARLAGESSVELQFLGAARSLRDGALPLTFRAQAKDSPLAIGQPVTVIAQLTDKVNGLALPAEAVVRNPSNEFIVWIKSGAERFIALPVEFANLDAKTIVVTKGLAADNRVVVSGAALINQIR